MFVRKKQKSRGQALIEFALVMPLLSFILLGILDMGRIMFTYAQVSGQLRSALRYSSAVGFSGSRPYLDCTTMRDMAGENWFGTSTVTLTYDTGTTLNCAATGNVTEDQLENGDLLKISVTAAISFIAVPANDMTVTFSGQRTIVKELNIGSSFNDVEYDGLDDTWEFTYWGDTTTMVATQDPDGDGCNNGCEESRGSDPTVADTGTMTTLAGSSVSYMETWAQPANFEVTVTDCAAANNINVSWDAMSGIPAEFSSGYAILYNAATGAQIRQIGPALSSSSTGADTLTNGTAKTYYMITFRPYTKDGSTTWVKGKATDVITASCITPPEPTAFNATCSGGLTSFVWNDWSGSPPSSAEIREKENGGSERLVLEITDFTQTNCVACDTYSNGTKTYYMVAITNNVEGTPSSDISFNSC